MITKQIVFDSEELAAKEVELLNGIVKNYTYYIKHPELDKWAVRYNIEGLNWDIIKKYVKLDSLEDITKEWENKE